MNSRQPIDFFGASEPLPGKDAATPRLDDFRILAAGDAAFVVEFGDSIDRAFSERVLALADRIDETDLAGVVETVPTFRSLLVVFDPARVAFEALAKTVAGLVRTGRPVAHKTRTWTLPVCYDGSLAPDLADVAARAGLSVEALAARHASIVHHVYMLGFLPGQPYLGDLPDDLALPRLESPRARVEAGSVGIATRMTCVFPKATPCGLRVIGRTPIPLWSPSRPNGALLGPGEKVVFRPISLDVFHRLADEAARGDLEAWSDDAAASDAA